MVRVPPFFQNLDGRCNSSAPWSISLEQPLAGATARRRQLIELAFDIAHGGGDVLADKQAGLLVARCRSRSSSMPAISQLTPTMAKNRPGTGPASANSARLPQGGRVPSWRGRWLWRLSRKPYLEYRQPSGEAAKSMNLPASAGFSRN